MSKKGTFWDNPFGGVFDYNRDGKEDFGEQSIGYNLFEECTKEDDTDDNYLSDDLDLDFSPSNNYSWRNNVEVDYLLDVFPEHYETEEEYLEAVNEAKYAWRVSVPDGSKYGMNPRWYNSEEEYLTELNEHKYGWRKWYMNRDTYGLDVNDFETQDEFNSAFNSKLEERRQKQRDEREKERRQKQSERQKEDATVTDDKKIYTICGVAFPHATHPYHYRTEDMTLKIGDAVLVPVGDKEAEGTIISVGQYTRQAAPFPIDKMKTIIAKV